MRIALAAILGLVVGALFCTCAWAAPQNPSMRVTVVEMRATGMKLTEAELAAAPALEGELFVTPTAAYLCGGPHPNDWPAHGHLLPPLAAPVLRHLRGDGFVLTGTYYRDTQQVYATQPQAWWCRLPRTVSAATAGNASAAGSDPSAPC